MSIVLLAAACARTPAPGHAGSARFSLQPRSAGLSAPLCADFSVTPFALTAGGLASPAGAPVVIIAQAGQAATAAVVGCIDSLPSPANDWSYLVTASHFTDCAGNPYPGASQAPITQTVAIDCQAGLDVVAKIAVDVPVVQAGQGGYLDVTVTVGATQVQVGCKQADVDPGGQLHFGHAWMQSASIAGVPASLTQVTPGALTQFGSTVFEGGQSDLTFAGLLTLPASGATVVQSFAPACGPGQMLLATQAGTCVTDAALPNQASTQTFLADVLAIWPNEGSVVARMKLPDTVELWTSLGAPALQPPASNANPLSQHQLLGLGVPLLGLWPSKAHSEEMFALVQSSTGAALITLTLDPISGLWSAAAPVPLTSYTAAQLAALGVFGQGGCVPAQPPACIPGPLASACTPTASGIPVPTPGGATVFPTNAGCVPGTVYQPDVYLEFNPSQPHADSSGNGRDMIGFNGNALPPVSTGPSPGGGYLASKALNYYEFFSLAGAPATASHGATLEMLLRFNPDGGLGAPGPPRYGLSVILGLGSAIYGGLGGDTVRFALYSYASVGFSASIGVMDASADGMTTALGQASFEFPMDGFNGRSWQALLDNQFHHFALLVDLDNARVSLSIDGKVEDGWTQPLPSAAALTGLDHHQRMQTVGAGSISWGFNGAGFRGDLDEIAWTPVTLPQTLLAQHAAEGAAQQHYDFTDQCPVPPPVPPSTDPAAVAWDFAPTVDGTEPPANPWPHYLAGGQTSLETAVPLQLASQQLLSFPLPRYAPGNTVPRMDHWLDPTYYAWIPEFEGNVAGAFAERGTALVELVRHWNFHSYLATGLRSTPSAWDIVANEGAHSLSHHTFLSDAQVSAWMSPADSYAGKYTRSAAAAFHQAGALKGQALLTSYNSTLANEAHAPFVVQDVLIVEDGENISLSQYDYAWLSGSPDLGYFQTSYDGSGACLANPASGACAQEVSLDQADAVNLFRLAFYAGISSALPPATFPSVRFTWYWLDGFAVYQASNWELGGREASETQPGQLFEPANFVQHLSGTDEYITRPGIFRDQAHVSNNDLAWLDLSRGPEEAAGDFLMAPFLSAGWNDVAAADVRPPQMLSLVKYMVMAGAIAFRPGVFPTSDPQPSGAHLMFGRYPDSPGDGRESIWQAAVASYGQALASKVEARMRASKIAWENDDTGATHIFHQAGDPGNLAAVRREYDAANAPLQRYLVSTAVEGYDNGVGGQWRRSGNLTFDLTQGGPPVTLPARREGSFYSLDLDGPSPVLIQYDAWHEDGAFNYWRHGFDFEAEANDGLAAGSGGAQLLAATEAPAMATLNFTGFTSFLTVQSPGAQSWSLSQAALAPRAGYQFEPRSAWNTTTWYVWVRARNHGAGSAPVYVTLDSAAPMELGCISGPDWQWVRTNLVTGQAAALSGVTVDQPHMLWVAPGSSTLDLDQVRLVAEAGHMECPLSATCGCGHDPAP